MNSVNQSQHKVPQVYLKQFGYLDANNQWKVSVIDRNEKFTRQKSIGSFSAVTNIFDIMSDSPNIARIFEQLNGELETEYNTIVRELESDGMLSDKSYAYLLQIVANFIARSDEWRAWMLDMLEHENKENFLQIIVGHNAEDFAEFESIKQQPYFRILVEDTPAEVLNRVMIYFIDHLMVRLWNYEVTFIQSQDDKPWFTSTNPVVVNNQVDKTDIFAKDSEIYFPISPKFLAYIHFAGSLDKENILRSLESNSIHIATDEQNEELQKIIMYNPSEFVIISGELRYKVE
jgi:hypothetical protein